MDFFIFESLHKNTTLNTLDCSDDFYYLQELKNNDEVAKSLCEMLIHNQGLQLSFVQYVVLKLRLFLPMAIF